MNQITARAEFFDALAHFMSPRTDDVPMDALAQFAQLRYARQGVDFVFWNDNAPIDPPRATGKNAELSPVAYRRALVTAWRQAAARLLKHHGFNCWAAVKSTGEAMHFNYVNLELRAPTGLVRFDVSDQNVPMAIMGTEQRVGAIRELLTDLGKMSIEELDSYLYREDPTSRHQGSLA